MTRRLEEILGLPPLEDINETETVRTKEEILAESVQVLNALSTSEKIDSSLTSVTGLLAHDDEMDEIVKKALKSYKDLCDLGLNAPIMHAGKIYEVAGGMLRTALDARDAKVNKKLRMIELQIKKLRIDTMADKETDEEKELNNAEFDRNELLEHIVNQNKDNNSDK